MNTADMNQKTLRAACKDAKISGYGNLTVAAMREALDALATAGTDKETVAVTTQPIRKAHVARTVLVEKGVALNRHHNDDGSVTLYAKGVKVHRTASDQQIEDGEVAEDYDADADLERFYSRWFGQGQRKFGKTTYGHNWKRRAAAPAEGVAA